MAFAQLNQYIQQQLALDVAAYLNPKSQFFPHVQNYYAQNTGYFNEDTVKCVMFQCINAYITNYETSNHYLVRSEVPYPGFGNIADLWITYDTGLGAPAQNVAMEMKADFDADSVDEDVNLLDMLAGSNHSPFDIAYACYVVRQGHNGWATFIQGPTQPDVLLLPINVI